MTVLSTNQVGSVALGLSNGQLAAVKQR
jgi:hypothetical protein